jgi:hypothetical protein
VSDPDTFPWASGPAADPEPEPSTRRFLLVAVVVGVALTLVAVAVGVPLVVAEIRDRTRPTLDDVRVYEEVDADHTNNSVEYDPVPPVGGPHDPAWLDCGVYDEQVRDENTVHSLEHGTVWITYDPDLPVDEVRRLAELLPDEGILSPYPGQDAPVIITVWARQLLLDGADDERLPLFLEEYGDGHTAPEPFASCAGGVRIFEDEDDEEETGVEV